MAAMTGSLELHVGQYLGEENLFSIIWMTHTLLQKFSNSTNKDFVKLYWAPFHKFLTAVNMEREILPNLFSCKFPLQKYPQKSKSKTQLDFKWLFWMEKKQQPYLFWMEKKPANTILNQNYLDQITYLGSKWMGKHIWDHFDGINARLITK